jgi:DNA-binding transcriptional ArsR family regulator
MASPFYLGQLRQIRAVASPVRAAIVDALEVVGPATIVRLATALGYPPDGLYYHLKVLERVGLVVRTTPDNGTSAATFDVPGRPATLVYRLDDRQQARAMTKVVATMVRSAERSFRRAFAPGRADVEGPCRNLRAGRRTAWLTSRELRALNAHIERIHALFAHGRPQRAGARLHEFTYVLAPIAEKGRRAPAGSPREESAHETHRRRTRPSARRRR